MKIAIIGSGIAGLTCAHLLSRQHQIAVFESASWIGGHTHTVDFRMHGRDYAVDTGFIVFNDWTYPNFIKLLDKIGVRYKPTEMSFSVSDPRSDLEYNGHDLNTLFAQRSNLLSPPFWGMIRDILRFNREALDDYKHGRIGAQVTLGDYLKLGRYSQRFIDHYIVPMGAAIWSMSLADMLEFPVEFFIRFFKNHGLLSVSDRPQWYVVEGGSSAYVSPLTRGFSQHIRLNCPVFEVLRDEHGVTIQSPAGAERFDKVIFACHSDQALSLLAEPSRVEREILGAIGYAANDVVLHTDTRLLPNMNILQGIESPETFCVSLNQSEAIDPELILARFSYAHPQYSLAGITAQTRADELLGDHHSYFCGAYWGNGFHEDGVVSALRVAAAFGESL